MSMKLQLFKSRMKRFFEFIGAVLKTGAAYPLGRLIYGGKGIWLIGERPNQAQDNGYHFFKYLRENHPERRVYYVIKKDSDHLEKVAKLGEVLYYGKWKHWLMYFGCEAVISTHIRKVIPSEIWHYRQLGVRFKQKNKKTVFLQHGVIDNDIPFFYRESARVDLFICSAEPEYEFVKERYHYHDNEVQYTGMARYDALHDFELKRQILIMPTWRKWIVKEGYDIEHSDYVREWNKVLTDRRLIDAAEKAGYTILFYPHSEIQPWIDLFRSVDDTVVIARDTDYDVQTLLKESALLITDQSSVSFDFAYMRKPMLYFQFDNDDYYAKHYPKGYFDFERDGFGKVAYTANDLVENAVEAIGNGVVLTEEYNKRIDRFFPLYDRKNCERIYNETVKICNRNA